MAEHVTGLTHFVNQYLGQFALALLSALHIKPTNPELPIPEHVVMAMVVLLVGTVLALVLRSRLSVEKPGAMQQVAELLLTNPMGFGIKDLLEENVHHGASKFIPFVGSISVFVLLSNLMLAVICLLLQAHPGILVVGYWPSCFFLSRSSALQRASSRSRFVSGRTCSPAISSI